LDNDGHPLHISIIKQMLKGRMMSQKRLNIDTIVPRAIRHFSSSRWGTFNNWPETVLSVFDLLYLLYKPCDMYKPFYLLSLQKSSSFMVQIFVCFKKVDVNIFVSYINLQFKW